MMICGLLLDQKMRLMVSLTKAMQVVLVNLEMSEVPVVFVMFQKEEEEGTQTKEAN